MSQCRKVVFVGIVLVSAHTAVWGQDRRAESSVERTARNFFDTHDSNGDQKLTKQEFPAQLAGIFNRADQNRDGFVDLAEDITYRKRQRDNPSRRVPAGVRAIRDVEYARIGEKQLLLDLYVPEHSDEKLPLIVSKLAQEARAYSRLIRTR